MYPEKYLLCIYTCQLSIEQCSSLKIAKTYINYKTNFSIILREVITLYKYLRQASWLPVIDHYMPIALKSN